MWGDYSKAHYFIFAIFRQLGVILANVVKGENPHIQSKLCYDVNASRKIGGSECKQGVAKIHDERQLNDDY